MADQFPPIPYSMSDLTGWRRLALALRGILSDLARDSTPPGQVASVTLSKKYPGIQLSWTQSLKADRYLVWRNTSGDFDTADIVADKRDGRATSHFDNTTDVASTATLYYWIEPLNDQGIAGPKSSVRSTANSVPPFPGTVPNAEFNVIFQVADPDEIGDATALSSGTDDDQTLWAYVEGDEDYYTSTTLSTDGYTFP